MYLCTIDCGQNGNDYFCHVMSVNIVSKILAAFIALLCFMKVVFLGGRNNKQLVSL